jgi:hypothetical protein
MNFRPRPAFALAVCSAAVLGFSGCTKSGIRVYLAPKETAAAPETATPEPHGATAPKAPPKLSYTLPAGWEEATPNSVSLAAFRIKSGNAEANVNITPLPNLAGREAMVVNMWREQAGLPPIEDVELSKTLETVQIGDASGQMFEVLGAREGGAPLRIVTAFAHQPDASWFYKLSGDEALVAAQKPIFVEFLKSVRVTAAPAASPSPSAPPADAAPKWSGPIPEGWRQLSPGQMQVAKFAVPEKDGAKAEVFVSVFPNDTGGTLANVNRWRKQLGLAEVDQAGLAGTVAPLDPALPEAVLIDLKNEPRALLGAIVPRGSRWWFYKLLGDAPAVAAAREAFVTFAKVQPGPE